MTSSRPRSSPFIRALTAAVLAACTAPACGSGESSGVAQVSEPRARRVLVVTCDTLRADRLGIYGYDRDVSPNLDAFASGAVVFQDAYSSAPVTGPSLSSLMTSRLPDELGVSAGNRRHMGSDVVTLAEQIRDAGITTAAVVSNWVLRRPEPELGDVGLTQGFDHYDDRMTKQEVNREAFERIGDETTLDAVAWMQGQLDDDNDRFFMWVHYQDPHGPYTPPDEARELFDRPARDQTRLPVKESNLGHGGLPHYQVLGDERRADVYRDRYDAEIWTFDRALGELFDWLRANDLLEDTLVVFSADHGESLGENGYWFCHGENVHRETVRIPLVMRFPDSGDPPWPAGTRVDRGVASHLDIVPTVLEAFGLPVMAGARGRSLWSGKLPKRRPLVHVLGKPGSAKRWIGVTDGDHRMLRPRGQPAQLYDVGNDPAEEHDLAAEHPQRVKALLEVWQTLSATLSSSSEVPDPTLSDRDREALRALGYLGGDDD